MSKPERDLAHIKSDFEEDSSQSNAEGPKQVSLDEIKAGSSKVLDRDSAKHHYPQGQFYCRPCAMLKPLSDFNPLSKSSSVKYKCRECEEKFWNEKRNVMKHLDNGRINPTHPRNVDKKRKSENAAQSPKQRKRFNNSKILKVKKDILALRGVHAAAFFLTNSGEKGARLQKAFSSPELEELFGNNSMNLRFLQQCAQVDHLSEKPRSSPSYDMNARKTALMEEFIKCQSQVQNWSIRLNDAALALAADLACSPSTDNGAVGSGEINGAHDGRQTANEAARLVMRSSRSAYT